MSDDEIEVEEVLEFLAENFPQFDAEIHFSIFHENDYDLEKTIEDLTEMANVDNNFSHSQRNNAKASLNTKTTQLSKEKNEKLDTIPPKNQSNKKSPLSEITSKLSKLFSWPSSKKEKPPIKAKEIKRMADQETISFE